MVSEQEARAQAEAANRAKDRFLAMLCHELRTPLTPVLLTVTAMLDDPRRPPTFRPSLEMIRQNVELEARLIDDLLDVMRIDPGQDVASLGGRGRPRPDRPGPGDLPQRDPGQADSADPRPGGERASRQGRRRRGSSRSSGTWSRTR